MPLGKNSNIEDYIKDFKKSKASQFKGKSDKEIRDMAIAAYYDQQKSSEKLREALVSSMRGLLEENGKYSHIDFKPPESVSKAAERGLEYRKKNNGKGGLSNKQASKEGIGSGVQRATNLKNRNTVSPEVIKQMVSFFARHEKNKSVAKGKSPWEDKGRIAWLLWGGDSGKSWANKIKRQMDAADKKKNEQYKNKIKSIVSENTDMVNSLIDINTVYRKYKEMEILSHYYHLKTDSYAEHIALGDFYEALQDLTDQAIENILSYTDKMYFNCSSGIQVDVNREDIRHCLDTFRLYVSICTQASVPEGLKDIFIQTEQLVEKTLYLLQLK